MQASTGPASTKRSLSTDDGINLLEPRPHAGEMSSSCCS
jgi:hypothetical protein